MTDYLVAKCKHRNNCYSYKMGDCKGCNIWNYLYDEKALIEWCRKHNEDISMFTMKMHNELEGVKQNDKRSNKIC